MDNPIANRLIPADTERSIKTAPGVPGLQPTRQTEARRFYAYFGVSTALFFMAFATKGIHWHGTQEIHSLMEAGSTLLALFVGLMALAMYRVDKERVQLAIIGVGFLGTAVLDGYHCLATTSLFKDWFPSTLDSLIPWSWSASRSFLAIFVCLSWWATSSKQLRKETAVRIALVASVFLTITCFIFFAFYPLPSAHFDGWLGGRPQEYVAGLFLLAALIGYLRRGLWKSDTLDHWFNLSLIVGVFTQILFMSQSHAVFDCMFDTAHLLKTASYCCVGFGLAFSMSETFQSGQMARMMSYAVKNADHGVLILNQSEECEWINGEYERQLGDTTANIQGKPFSDFLCQQTNTPEKLAELKAAFRDQRAFDMELVFRRGPGDTFWSSVTGSPVSKESGEPTRFIVFAKDISERRNWEQHLRRTRRAIDNSEEGMITINQNAKIVDVNKVVCERLEYSREEMLNMSITELTPKLTLGDWRINHWNRLQSSGTTRFESVQQTKSGQLIPVEISAILFNDNGEQFGLSFIRDISKRLQAEQEKRDLTDELMTASRQAGMAEIATGVLHNVGNVLTSVSVSAGVLADQIRRDTLSTLDRASKVLDASEDNLPEFFSSEQGRQFPALLRAIIRKRRTEQRNSREEIEAMLANIDHIKQIVAVQQSYATARASSEPINIHDLLKQSLQIHGGGFARHQIRVEHTESSVPTIQIDKNKALQIIVNLISNAKNAMSECPIQREHCLRVAVEVGESDVYLSVSDTGVGIAQENLDKIFSHGFTTRKDGHGFGLHSSILAAQELGGELTAYSDGLGHGATFVLQLPIAVQSTANELAEARC